MKLKFGGNTKVRKFLLNSLRREFEILAMKNDETVTEYFARVMTIANQMRSNGEIMEDSKIVEKVLRTLTERFTYVVVSIEEAKDTDNMTVDELQSTLVVHEQKFRKLTTSNPEGEDRVLKVEERSGMRGRSRTSGFRGRGRGRTHTGRSTLECYNCHKLGHFAYECPSKTNEANYAELEEDEEDLLMAYVEKLDARRTNAWFVDSGCSNHMCGDPGMFTSLDKSFSHSVKLGNNTRMGVTGKGVVKITLNNVTYSIGNVYLVPELKNNLLSIGQLQERGVDMLFQKGVCKLFHPHRGKMAETTMSLHRMFVLLSETTSSSEEDRCLQTCITNQSKLWHQRYGHLSYKGLRTLHSKEMVLGLPQITPTEGLCDACMKGK